MLRLTAEVRLVTSSFNKLQGRAVNKKQFTLWGIYRSKTEYKTLICFIQQLVL